VNLVSGANYLTSRAKPRSPQPDKEWMSWGRDEESAAGQRFLQELRRLLDR